MCDMNTDVGVCYKTVSDNIRQWLMKTVDENAFIRILSAGLVKKERKEKERECFSSQQDTMKSKRGVTSCEPRSPCALPHGASGKL